MFSKQPFKYSPPNPYSNDKIPNRFSDPMKSRNNSFGPNQQPVFFSPLKNMGQELGLKSYRSETRPKIFDDQNENARFEVDFINGKIMNEITDIIDRKKSIKTNQGNHPFQSILFFIL